MDNPYSSKPDYQFWRRSFRGKPATEIDPITAIRFSVSDQDRVATAGSCFAQHVARTLRDMGFDYMVTEAGPAFDFSGAENYGTFTARFGNIYTVRQLLQLFRRAYDLFEPADSVWRRTDGRFVDPFRPNVIEAGFANEDELLADRETHMEAVRRMFEDCDVFIFTLGLTEAWESAADGAIFPLHPGVVRVEGDSAAYRFRNFKVAEVEADLSEFLTAFHRINPTCRVLLTVSPVALMATFEDRHVLTATTLSKSVLRVAAEGALQKFPFVDYFPSYEMILGPHGRGSFLAEDFREVTAEGVAYAMSKFAAHYLNSAVVQPEIVKEAPAAAEIERQRAAIREIADIICDEEKLDPDS